MRRAATPRGCNDALRGLGRAACTVDIAAEVVDHDFRAPRRERERQRQRMRPAEAGAPAPVTMATRPSNRILIAAAALSVSYRK